MQYKGKVSFQSLGLMIQNSLNGAQFSFVHGSKHLHVLQLCSHYGLQETMETSDTHVFEEGNYTQEGVKTESVK